MSMHRKGRKVWRASLTVSTTRRNTLTEIIQSILIVILFLFEMTQ